MSLAREVVRLLCEKLRSSDVATTAIFGSIGVAVTPITIASSFSYGSMTSALYYHIELAYPYGSNFVISGRIVFDRYPIGSAYIYIVRDKNIATIYATVVYPGTTDSYDAATGRCEISPEVASMLPSVPTPTQPPPVPVTYMPSPPVMAPQAPYPYAPTPPVTSPITPIWQFIRTIQQTPVTAVPIPPQEYHAMVRAIKTYVSQATQYGFKESCRPLFTTKSMATESEVRQLLDKAPMCMAVLPQYVSSCSYGRGFGHGFAEPVDRHSVGCALAELIDLAVVYYLKSYEGMVSCPSRYEPISECSGILPASVTTKSAKSTSDATICMVRCLGEHMKRLFKSYQSVYEVITSDKVYSWLRNSIMARLPNVKTDAVVDTIINVLSQKDVYAPTSSDCFYYAIALGGLAAVAQDVPCGLARSQSQQRRKVSA